MIVERSVDKSRWMAPVRGPLVLRPTMHAEQEEREDGHPQHVHHDIGNSKYLMIRDPGWRVQFIVTLTIIS